MQIILTAEFFTPKTGYELLQKDFNLQIFTTSQMNSGLKDDPI